MRRASRKPTMPLMPKKVAGPPDTSPSEAFSSVTAKLRITEAL